MDGKGGGTSRGISHSGTVLVGTYRVIEEEIRYRITEPFQELLGTRNIIFQRVEDYKPIDPEWIENFVFRPELEQ